MSYVAPPPELVVRSYPPRNRWRLILAVVVGGLVTLLAGAWGARLYPGFAGNLGALEYQTLINAQAELEVLQQRVAVLQRSEQVAKAASIDLQQVLRERQEEIAGLRADLAFYSRLTGGNGKREGLAVHSLQIKPVEHSRAFNFTITLTQSVKKGHIINGHLRIKIEGVQGRQLTTLDWPELRQGQDAADLEFTFKYFQRVQSTGMLPDGFTPNRIHVIADVNGENNHLEQEFAWTEALANEELSDVLQ